MSASTVIATRLRESPEFSISGTGEPSVYYPLRVSIQRLELRKLILVEVTAVPLTRNAPRISRSELLPEGTSPDGVQAVVAKLTRRVQAKMRNVQVVYRMDEPETIKAPYVTLKGTHINKIIEPFDYVRSNDAVEVAALTRRQLPHQRVYRIVPLYPWNVPVYLLATPDEADVLCQQLIKITRDKTRTRLRESPEYKLNPTVAACCLDAVETLVAPTDDLVKIASVLKPFDYVRPFPHNAGHDVAALTTRLQPGQRVYAVSNRYGTKNVFFLATPDELDGIRQQLEQLKRRQVAGGMAETISTVGVAERLGEPEVTRLLEDPEYRAVDCDYDARPDPQPGQVGRMLYHAPEVESYRWDKSYAADGRRVSVNVRLFARVRNIPPIVLSASIATDSVDDPRVKAKERELVAAALAQADETRPVYSLACPPTIKIGDHVKLEQVRALLEPYDYVQATDSGAGHINVAGLSARRQLGERVYRVLVGHTTFYLNATPEDAEALKLALDRLARIKAKKVLQP